MKFLSARISDKITKYYETYEVQVTSFLDPAEIVEVNGLFKNIPYVTYGGYEEAERKVIFIGLDEFSLDFNKYINVIRIKSNDKLSHRAVLGSVLGLGVKHEMIGDILINDTSCDIIVLNLISEFLLNNLKFVGREKVTVSVNKLEELIKAADSSKKIKTTVNSLRVDAVISAAYGISREESAKLVKGEFVKINFLETKNPSTKIKEGDIISVRGKGRVTLAEVLGQSKSDRIKVVLVRK